MARKQSSNIKSARAQAKAIQKANAARLRQRQKIQRQKLKEQQNSQRIKLRDQHKIERQRIKKFRHAGAVLKRKKVSGFTTRDWRKALPTRVFQKTGKSSSKAEKTIARLGDVVKGIGKLIRVKSKQSRDNLKTQGATVQGEMVLVRKDQYVDTKAVEIKPQHIGKVSARIRVDYLAEDIQRYFAKHPGKEVGVQLGDGQFPLYVTFDDPDSLIDYLETNFSSALVKQAFSEIILITVEQLDKVRHRLAERRRAELGLGLIKPKRQLSGRSKDKHKLAVKRYYLRHKDELKAKRKSRGH